MLTFFFNLLFGVVHLLMSVMMKDLLFVII
jgi:hypothetical protein